MTVKLCAEPPGSMDYVSIKENMLDVKMQKPVCRFSYNVHCGDGRVLMERSGHLASEGG
jgi:hypothetical protein